MFYWNRKTEKATTIEQELMNCGHVQKIQVASAFISVEGVNILQNLKDTYGLKKNDITLYISSQFSASKPHELLKRLNDLCITKIIFDRSFHAKVYFMQGNNNKLIYGSSNFTRGGMADNIEFNSITTPDADTLAALNKFFMYCDNASVKMTTDIIQYYEDNASDIESLKLAQKKLSNRLSGYIRQNDPFSPDDYDLEDYYFNYEDYETFFPRNHKSGAPYINVRRKQVQDKMMRIHNKIYPQIKKLGVACHKRPDNISSLIIPCVFNHFIVAWIGVRYGKTPNEIDALNYAQDKDDDAYGFQKHGCLQYCIVQDGFEINLFLAVKHDAIDRDYFRKNIIKLRPKVEAELEKLRGYGMQWVINSDETEEEFVFDIDSQDPAEFCAYFKEYDCDGRESFLRIYYEPDNELIKSFESICDEIVSTVKVLVPLYNAMVFRPKGI